jgi:hypothetical protein
MTSCEWWLVVLTWRPSSSPAPLNETDDHHDNGHDQQDMDEPAHRVTADQTEQLQND